MDTRWPKLCACGGSSVCVHRVWWHTKGVIPVGVIGWWCLHGRGGRGGCDHDSHAPRTPRGGTQYTRRAPAIPEAQRLRGACQLRQVVAKLLQAGCGGVWQRAGPEHPCAGRGRVCSSGGRRRASCWRCDANQQHFAGAAGWCSGCVGTCGLTRGHAAGLVGSSEQNSERGFHLVSHGVTKAGNGKQAPERRLTHD
jgi:hypothetical protein